MTLKEKISRFFSGPPEVRREKNKLGSCQSLACDPANLRSRSAIRLEDLFRSDEIDAAWNETVQRTAPLEIPDGTGGVNPGDRRALYYLIYGQSPASVLEVGTHIGASTVNIASALHMSRVQQGKPASLTTVDINDVNCQETKRWLEFGTKKSPLEMIEELGHEAFVEFVANSSLNYFEQCERRFDFIFLDGTHAAKTVYQEIPEALKLLEPGGVILLHDYYPNMKQLWSESVVIPGPYLATERYIKEGAPLTVLPLGNLPWPTKLGTNLTTLALLLRND